jgi:hypothetical protein
MVRIKTSLTFAKALFVSACLFCGCTLPSSTPSNEETPFSLSTMSLFPFQNISNWWHYTEQNGNVLAIAVIDTISDNGITYYKVSFKEKNRDTTDDWFRSSAAGIQYSTHLIDTYETFLPAQLQGKNGSFKSATNTVNYSYLDTSRIGGTLFSRVVACKYPSLMLHGFNEIDFADSIGIVSMIDTTGRFPTVYTLDSSSIDGVVRTY